MNWLVVMGLFIVALLILVIVDSFRMMALRERVYDLMMTNPIKRWRMMEISEALSMGLYSASVSVALSSLGREGLVDSQEDLNMTPEELEITGGLRLYVYFIKPGNRSDRKKHKKRVVSYSPWRVA